MIRPLILLLCLSAPLSSLPPAMQQQASKVDDGPAETARLYESAIRLVRDGKDLTRAIQRLETVVRRDGSRAEYHSALACAYASRFAFVATAAKSAERYESERQWLEKMKKEW